MKILIALLAVLSVFPIYGKDAWPQKKILIVAEGNSDFGNFAIGDSRQLANLLAHFNTNTQIKGVNQYYSGELNNFDYIFYLGFTASNSVPSKFLNDFIKTDKQVIWLNTGLDQASKRYDLKNLFGFAVTHLDTTSEFDYVKTKKHTFTKGEPNTSIVEISDRKNVTVLATAYSSKSRKEVPYIVKSKNLLYITDSPFASAGSTDRYLLFADMLHDILKEPHEESHSAIIRIEDITPLDNPEKLREIADVLAERNIPFLVGVVPFYINYSEGLRISLSDKPELVDALKYMVRNGATIVMHGSTHQYKGITSADFEFWDENANSPIKEETETGIQKKIEMGLNEFTKNGLYPLLWETPHYTGSFKLYSVISKYFSTAIEQRLSIENSDYSQFFPYIINNDLFGQKIFPENLGYIPLDEDINVSRAAVHDIIKGAKANLAVRDGFASCFFHEFLDIELLKSIVDSVKMLGYEYIDVRESVNWVKTKDKVILSGSQNYSIKIEDQYLSEFYFNINGEISKKNTSSERLSGTVNKSVKLKPGEFYFAEPTEVKERELSFWEKLNIKAGSFFETLFKSENDWREARVAIMWNHYALGAGYNDQASFAATFRSVNIAIDTIFLGQKINPTKYNLIIVPYCIVDSLQEAEFDLLVNFVNAGGNIITDAQNELANTLGVKFSKTKTSVYKIRDLLFPDEQINWRYNELATKFETDISDKVFCIDDNTRIPMVIGRRIGKGKFIYINSLFDSYSYLGYSNYPFLLEYVRQYFNLYPVIRQNNIEMFFDPGFRHTYSIENLVKQWVNQGIRLIHVAGWHKYPKYSYDYDRLIKLAHANGILVYAWLEPPQVSQKFWNDHPEWREKNWKGEDVRPSWRYPVALTDNACVAAMIQEYSSFLKKYNWDGVNVAELYFEAAKGFENPNLFTPMHPSAQKEIMKLYGIDINGLFNPQSPFYWKTHPAVTRSITSYRVNKLTEIYEALFASIIPIKNANPGFQIIVTAMDSFGSPELREYIGVDMSKIISLQKKYNFVLNVEDPENLWSTDPLRYVEIGKKYSELLGGNKQLMLDLNILKFRKSDEVTPFPTLIQTGTECFQLINAAVAVAPRAVVYAESSINPQDFLFIPYALANKVSYEMLDNGLKTKSPYSFFLKLPNRITELSIDGNLIAPSRDNQYIIPAGSHTISFTAENIKTFSAHELQTRILSFNANLLNVYYGMRSINMEYNSETRVLLSLNRDLTKIFLDGAEYQSKSMKGNDCYTIFLPPGHHTVYLIAGDEFSYGINLTSLWSTTAIAILGSAGVLSLILMFVYVRIKRIKEEGEKK